MSAPTNSDSAAAALALATEQGRGIGSMENRAYRMLAAYHRAMMVAFFYDDAKFEQHAQKMAEYVSYGTLGDRRHK